LKGVVGIGLAGVESGGGDQGGCSVERPFHREASCLMAQCPVGSLPACAMTRMASGLFNFPPQAVVPACLMKCIIFFTGVMVLEGQLAYTEAGYGDAGAITGRDIPPVHSWEVDFGTAITF